MMLKYHTEDFGLEGILAANPQVAKEIETAVYDRFSAMGHISWAMFILCSGIPGMIRFPIGIMCCFSRWIQMVIYCG